ncbi:MGMT family protein [Promicromonospora sukumoe]|uniref:MGMT family protein n=1 Tax=Promicromonospora sukumoe TaxID=88382 RepID=UPI0037C76B32
MNQSSAVPPLTDVEEYAAAVLDVVRRIPSGRAMTYGLIAEIVGEELGRGGPRQVGSVLAGSGSRYAHLVPDEPGADDGGALGPGGADGAKAGAGAPAASWTDGAEAAAGAPAAGASAAGTGAAAPPSDGDRVPWWRVVNAAGSPPQHHLTEALDALRAEGCPLTKDGRRVHLRRAVWFPEDDTQPR